MTWAAILLMAALVAIIDLRVRQQETELERLKTENKTLEIFLARFGR